MRTSDEDVARRLESKASEMAMRGHISEWRVVRPGGVELSGASIEMNCSRKGGGGSGVGMKGRRMRVPQRMEKSGIEPRGKVRENR